MKFIFFIVERWDGVVATSIVVEDVELTTCDFRDAVAELPDRFVGRELEEQVGDVLILGAGVWVFADCREDMVACVCEPRNVRPGCRTLRTL